VVTPISRLLRIRKVASCGKVKDGQDLDPGGRVVSHGARPCSLVQTVNYLGRGHACACVASRMTVSTALASLVPKRVDVRVSGEAVSKACLRLTVVRRVLVFALPRRASAGRAIFIKQPRRPFPVLQALFSFLLSRPRKFNFHTS
jgi:hypothetical protein